MKTTKRTSTTLVKGGHLRFTPKSPVEIGCDVGTLWITQDNDTRDVVLTAGERFTSDRDGTVLVYALEPATVTTARKVDAALPSLRDVLFERLRLVGVVRQPAMS